VPFLRRDLHLFLAHIINVDERVGGRRIALGIGRGAKALGLYVFPRFFRDAKVVEAPPFVRCTVKNKGIVVARLGVTLMH
jgi:hypothetical protein